MTPRKLNTIGRPKQEKKQVRFEPPRNRQSTIQSVSEILTSESKPSVSITSSSVSKDQGSGNVVMIGNYQIISPKVSSNSTDQAAAENVFLPESKTLDDSKIKNDNDLFNEKVLKQYNFNSFKMGDHKEMLDEY